MRDTSTTGAAERSRQRSALMARAQAGDQDAYRMLLDDVGQVLRGFLRRRVADASEVEDVLQDALLAMHRARHTFDPGRPLEPWLFAIARNVTIDHARRRLSRGRWELLVDDLPDYAGGLDESGAPRLDEVLARLPASQREAFEMLKLEGLTVEAAAARAGTTPGALKVRAHRAYRALRAMLGGDE
jgi:RNA polymerase sigma-70 factor (ECF subfamily)